MSRRITIAALALVGTTLTEARGVAQQRLEIESSTPADAAASPPTDPPIVFEPPAVAVPRFEFDSADLDAAKMGVLWNRNWFLASAGAQALGWILLGAGISQCEWINGVEVCPRAADNVGVAGAAIVILSGVPLIVTSIMYGVRAGQKKELELRTLRELTDNGRRPPPSSFDEYRLNDAEDRIRRTRNGLIASTAMFGFGWIFLGASIPHCRPGTNELLDCSGTGYALFVVGLTFSGSGAIGMITSGILLGVRKRNERLLQRSIRRRNEARFRWDPQSGAFVF
jgi:hypothetical protein